MDVENFVNLGLLRNPYNWVAVALMLLFFLASLEVLSPAFAGLGSDVNRIL